MKIYLYIILILCGCSIAFTQPQSPIEESEGLVPLIGRYISSISYSGSDSAWINASKRTQTFDLNDRATGFMQETWTEEEWVNEMKWDYTYENDNMTKLTTYGYEEDAWFENGKREFEFDENGRITLNTGYYVEVGELKIADQTITVYDDEGRILENTTFINVGMRPDTSKVINTYNEDGLLIERLNQGMQADEWVDINKVIFTYDESGLLIERLNQGMQADEWVDINKEIFTYDENDNIIEYLNQNYDNDEWEDYYKIFWTYENGRLSTRLERLWDFYEGGWVDRFKDSLVYDENGRTIDSLRYKDYDGDLENYERFQWTYDINGQIIEILITDGEGYLWGAPQRTTYTYDENGNLIEQKQEQFSKSQDKYNNKEIAYYEYDAQNLLTSFSKYIWSSDDWTRAAMMTYEYAPVGVNSVPVIQMNAFNYPNPFSNETTIEFSIQNQGDVSITIHDMSGRPVGVSNLRNLSSGEHQYKFNSSKLPSGVYFYRITGSGEQIMNSFMINK
ncbi:T9SS type A sorting domain-containing protein [Bacteroidota bacterium]